MSGRRPLAVAALLYAVLSLAMVAPALAPGRTLSSADTFWFQAPWAGVKPASLVRPSNPDIDDVPGVYVPFTQYLRREAPALPLWNPYIMSGRPFEANSQSALFSPFTWLSVGLPLWRSFAFVAALKLFLGAFGTFLLARALGLRLAGGLLAGVVYGFSLWSVEWVAFTDASVWVLVPWLLWATDRVVRRADGPAVALLGAVVALQFFGGHPESSFHALAMTVLFFVLRVAWLRPAGLPRTVGAFALGLAGGGAVAAVALLPFFELLQRSADLQQRAGLGSHSKLPVRFALGMAMPDYWGRGTQTAIVRFQFGRAFYGGALPLLLAALAVVRRPNLPRLAFAGFGLACMLIVFGIPPLFDAVTALPGFAAAHNERMAILALLCLGLVAGWGLDDLLARERARWRWRRAAIAGAALVVVAPVASLVASGHAPVSSLGRGLDVAWGFVHPPPLAARHAADVVRDSAVILWASFAGAGALLLALRLRGRLGATAFATLALALVAGDLFRAGMGQNPAIARADAVQPATGAIRYLQARRPARFVGVGFIPHTMLPMRYRLYDARGYDLPIDGRYDRLWRREVSPELPSQVHGSFLPLALTVVRVDDRRMRTLDLLGVADLLQPPDAPAPRAAGLRLAYAGPDARVYANDRALPRAWVVGAQRVVKGGVAALRATTSATFDPRAEAVTEQRIPRVPVEANAPRSARPSDSATAASSVGSARSVPRSALSPAASALPSGAAYAGSARIVAYAPDRVALRASAPRGGLLVLSDVAYPGWKATVDGRGAGLHRVDYVLRGVRLPPGAHRVEMRFEPATFTIGWIVSAMAAVGLAALALLWRRRQPSARAVQTSTPPAS
jgi:hypothetical protein